jgi:hypothetical protein
MPRLQKSLAGGWRKGAIANEKWLRRELEETGRKLYEVTSMATGREGTAA